MPTCTRQGNEEWAWKSRGATYRSKSNSRGSQTYQATVSGMRLMNSICIIVTKLIDDGFNLGVFLSGD